MQSREDPPDDDRRRMRIHEISLWPKQARIGDAVQLDRSVKAGLCEIDRETGKLRAARKVRLHGLRTSGEKRDIYILERIRGNDLSDLNFSGKLLQQPRVLLRFEQSQTADGQTASL